MPNNLLPSSMSPDLGSSDIHEPKNVHETPNAVNPTGLLLNQYEELSHHLAGLIVVTLCLGSPAIWNGMLLSGMYPRIASATGNFDVGLVFVAFYGMVISSIPPALKWVSWLCCVLTCLLLVLSLLPVKSTGRSTQSNSPGPFSNPV